MLPHCRILRAFRAGVHFSPDVESLAPASGILPTAGCRQLVKDTVARMLDNRTRFIAGVQKGIAQADRGEFVGTMPSA